MKIRKATTLAAAAALSLALTATACSSSDEDGLTVGIKVDQPGLGLKTPEGTFEGFDVDVATYIAKELGVEADDIDFVEAKTPERETLLQNGDVDFIVATYSITDSRKEKVSFAGPYFIAHQDLLIRADDAVSTNDDINALTLCSVQGSTSAQNVRDNFAPDAQMQTFDTYSDCLTGLGNGTVDALTTDDTILAGYAAQDAYAGQFKLAGLTLSDERYGVGVAKDDTELRDDINAAIEKMIEDGSWETYVEKNFGPAGYQAEAAPEVTETD